MFISLVIKNSIKIHIYFIKSYAMNILVNEKAILIKVQYVYNFIHRGLSRGVNHQKINVFVKK